MIVLIKKKNTTPFFQVPNDIFDQEIKVTVKEKKNDKEQIIERTLLTSEKLVFVYLCRCGNNNASAFPSYATIADKCGISRRKAIDVIKVLQENKLIQKTTRKNADETSEKKHHSNVYKTSATIAPVKPKNGASDSLGGELSAPGVVQPLHQGGELSAPIKRTPYKEPIYKEPFKKENDFSFSPKGETVATPLLTNNHKWFDVYEVCFSRRFKDIPAIPYQKVDITTSLLYELQEDLRWTKEQFEKELTTYLNKYESKYDVDFAEFVHSLVIPF